MTAQLVCHLLTDSKEKAVGGGGGKIRGPAIQGFVLLNSTSEPEGWQSLPGPSMETALKAGA